MAGEEVLINIESSLEDDQIPSPGCSIERLATPPIIEPPGELGLPDKGKAPIIDEDVKPELQTVEGEGLGSCSVFAVDANLDNSRLVKTLLKSIILRKDWEETQKQRVEDTLSSIYPRMLKVSIKAVYKIFF